MSFLSCRLRSQQWRALGREVPLTRVSIQELQTQDDTETSSCSFILTCASFHNVLCWCEGCMAAEAQTPCGKCVAKVPGEKI